VRKLAVVILVSGLLLAISCGGGGSSSSGFSTAGGNTIATSGNNVAPLTVDTGPPNLVDDSGHAYVDVNVAFTTLMVCAQGSTSNCQTIDHVAVDTGSAGLRIPYSALSASLASALQNVNTSSPLAECVQFMDNSFFWGSVRSADVYMGGAGNNGEVAHMLPIQLMGDPAMQSSIPADCSTTTTLSGQQVSGTEKDTVSSLGANGLIGVGVLQYDCDVFGTGNACISSTTLPPGTYYACPGGSCTNSGISVPLAQQVRNPVSAFATDNNGVILELPSVPVGGQASVSGGSMIFGIGTQSNNALGSATVLALDTNINDPQWSGFTTVYNNVSYPNSNENTVLQAQNLFTIGSFIDSGSNAIYFLDNPTSGIPVCTNPNLNFLYCPSGTQALSATNKSVNGNSKGVNFNVSNASTLNGSFAAFSDLAGPNSPPGATVTPIIQASDGYFDWGLPFFYGRNVYTAIQGVAPPNGVPSGPWWAY
jgi:hypothetical protein